MNLRDKMIGLDSTAETLIELTRSINRRCNEMTSAKAVIPADAPYPASYFKGCEVFLSNVVYDPYHGSISAVITLPYGVADINGNQHPDAGSKIKVTIDRTWFDDIKTE